MDWLINIKFGAATHSLKAEKIYHSDQVMRIKVYGKKGFLLLENDYPFVQLKNSKKAIKWKVKESYFNTYNNQQNAQLVVDIIHKLEDVIKDKNPVSRIDYIRDKKSW